MKTELDHNFELGDDPEFTRFCIENLLSLFVIAYFLMVMGGWGIVVFFDWILKRMA